MKGGLIVRMAILRVLMDCAVVEIVADPDTAAPPHVVADHVWFRLQTGIGKAVVRRVGRVLDKEVGRRAADSAGS